MGAQQVGITRGPTNPALISLLCPKSWSVARKRSDKWSDRLVPHLMHPEALGGWYVGSHYWAFLFPILIILGFTFLSPIRNLLHTRCYDFVFVFESFFKTLIQFSFLQVISFSLISVLNLNYWPLSGHGKFWYEGRSRAY